MAGVAPEGSQFDVRQFDAKMTEILGADGEEFFTSYDEVYDSFDAMGLQENLLRGIYAYGFEKPSAIQQRGIVPFCKGLDVIQQAQSGIGKIATFCSGVLQQLDYGVVECQALVLAPTRELAQQIEKVMRALGDYLGVKVHACVGGTSVREDQRILSSGVHVVVGTPGRVFDMLHQDHTGISNVAPADSPLRSSPIRNEENETGLEAAKDVADARIHDYISNLQFYLSATAFFQVNTLAVEKLYSLAGDWAGLGPDTLLFDIWCGTGTIGLTLAHRVGMVVGIEINASAVSDAILTITFGTGLRNCC